MAENEQFLRKVGLSLVEGEKVLDVSEMRITFEVRQDDEQSPNNAAIRVYNLSPETTARIKGEYGRVVLQAGYENASYGVIFDGNIKQYRQGREQAKTTYLDILAADGDAAFNYAMVNAALPAGSTPRTRLQAAISVMEEHRVKEGRMMIPGAGGILPRGKVLFGLARAILRQQTENLGATWNISNGEVNIVPLTGYLPGEAVVLTSATGLIGRPEQTQGGITARCLINPRIQVGGLVKIDNKSINTTEAAKRVAIAGAQLPFDKYAGIQMFADVAADGLYRVYVIEYSGDSRGLPWWMDLVMLAVDPVTLTCKAYG
jgi:hypothetical protein